VLTSRSDVGRLMRVWDIHPGYLNRESLLGEHREVHAIFSIVLNARKGYAHHPETLRWRSSLGALGIRHDLLVCEMLLRGYRHHSPVPTVPAAHWPKNFIDTPHMQFAILNEKYRMKGKGRIPLPINAQQLWAQHKYSVLARAPGLYKRIGLEVARRKGREFFAGLSHNLVEALRVQPPPGRLMNALQHMWGHVSSFNAGPVPDIANTVVLISEIWKRSRECGARYLLESTALSDLALWAMRDKDGKWALEE
jgi:hypothetical protein